MGSRKSKRKQAAAPGAPTRSGRAPGETAGRSGRPPHGGRRRLVLAAVVVAAAALALTAYGLLRTGGKTIRNVVLVSIDTCRADHLGCYGYASPITPNIDALARRGVRFDSVITPYPMTLPAHCSMLTGTYPKTHGVRWNSDRLAEAHVTLASVLRAAGYQTAGFVGGFPMSAKFGLGQGFETYDDQFPKTGPGDDPERKADEVSRRGMEWLEQHNGRPFFLFLHYYDPHLPYDPPPPLPQTYDGELAYVDLWIGKVLDKLHALGLDDDTLVVVTGDHGEGLMEHGEQEHGFLVYQNTVDVPLIVYDPAGARGGRVEGRISLVDLMPTVLGRLGLTIPPRVQGRDLSSYLAGGAFHAPYAAGALRPDAGGALHAPERLLYSETVWPEAYNCNALYCILDGRWKYIQSRKPELYDLRCDGGEKDNLVARDPALARRLQAGLEGFRKAMPAAADLPGGSSAAVDKETLQRLESLGYIGGGVVREQSGPDAGQEDPKDFVALFERCKTGFHLMGKRQYSQAEKILREVVARRPGLILARNWLADMALRQKHPGEAIVQLSAALSVLAQMKDSPMPLSRERSAARAGHMHKLLAGALLMDGKPDAAIAELRIAIGLVPDFEDHLKLIECLSLRGRYKEAVAECRKLLETAPENVRLRNNLAWILATCPDASVRDGAKALEMAQALVQTSSGRDAAVLDTLAAAYAETGQFTQAAATAQQALARVRSGKQPGSARAIQSRLDLYRAGRPFRETPK